VNARVATNVSSTFLNSLPVQVNGNSRSPFDLASAGAGEVNSAGTFRIGGGNDTVGVTLDGTSLAGTKIGSDAGDGGAAAMNSPSVEALTEFSVVTSGFKAEFGQASGGTLSFVSKSGTNQIHGSAFEFMRNQDFDAKGFFNSVRPIYKQNFDSGQPPSGGFPGKGSRRGNGPQSSKAVGRAGVGARASTPQVGDNLWVRRVQSGTLSLESEGTSGAASRVSLRGETRRTALCHAIRKGRKPRPERPRKRSRRAARIARKRGPRVSSFSLRWRRRTLPASPAGSGTGS